MKYFSKVKTDDEVFSLIYGKGIVTFVAPKKNRIDGFYLFAVEYKKKKLIHYTAEGFPNWCASDGCVQTVFYLKDIDLTDIDIQPSDKLLTKKQILKLQEKGKLEIRCPSGIWRDVDRAPSELVKKALKKDNYYLFRKGK